MKKIILKTTVVLIMTIINFQAYSSDINKINRKDSIEAQIWKLEETYFDNLYKANYDSVLLLVDENYLGWPGSCENPLDKAASSVFMKQLIPSPVICTIKIERKAISIEGNIALTHYIINASCQRADGTIKTSSSRITHTWIFRSSKWKILGGMSSDK